MSLLLAVLAQVGPFVTPGPAPVSPLPREVQQRQAIERQRAQQTTPATPQVSGKPETKLSACLATIAEDADGAAEAAQGWLDQAKGVERAEAGQCLGSALVALQQFGEAQAALIAARDAAAPGDHLARARLGAMAGNAALAGGNPAAALAVLDVARNDAGAGADKDLMGGIATDRARALVALKRDPEAAVALADARAAAPADAQAWLLSATLSRRMGKLGEAQAQIEQAALLLPIDPEIGLEAGVIAVLAGHDQAAIKSWRSVVAAAPKSAAATTAQGYLAQLGDTAQVQSGPVQSAANAKTDESEAGR